MNRKQKYAVCVAILVFALAYWLFSPRVTDSVVLAAVGLIGGIALYGSLYVLRK